MKNIYAICAFAIFASNIAAAKTVVGYAEMTRIYQDYIVGDGISKPKMPKFYLFDTETNTLLARDKVIEVLGLAPSDVDKVKNFIGDAIDLPKSVSVPSSLLKLEADNQYVMFYFNMPKDAYGAVVAYHPTIKEDHAFLVNTVSERSDVQLLLTF
ncbi:hypothetical protein [Alteromonas sp. BMJM2]|uniref:hypothetical protein n=1 Tax=Alteromonas sp. BMJM2 TaxID=2954241 RepID=UPI0022B35A9B|nr:hypothetical protein [Alteromonas sp. BMJM2]